ncbi:MAG: hypothetical protein HY718_12130 [Planctomycetes bacterium]|nr:hypothetical protein [Planctomycetota bacterium]
MLQRAYLLIIAIGVVAGTGCSQVSRPEQAQQGEQVNADAFLHEHLQRQPMVTVSEAYRALTMLAEGEDKYDSFASREEYLLQHGFIRHEWKLQRDMAIDRGSVAYAVVQILKIRGGVNFNALGRLGIGDRRYAVRELAYVRIMQETPPYRFMSGAELVDVIGNADAYMAKEGLYPQELLKVEEGLTNRPDATK